MAVALLLTVVAGLATGLGGLAVFLTNRTNGSFLALSLGFSAGVMLYVSFVEILAEASDLLSAAWGPGRGTWGMVGGFFAGIAVIAVIDRLVPHQANPHEFAYQPGDAEADAAFAAPAADSRLLRTGMLTALAIAIHNFPEGFATFAAALGDPSVAVAITVAIALHNIPEGIAVAVPVFQATGSRARAIGLSFLSGLSEPLGAVIGFLLLRPFLTDALFGASLAAVAGIMVFISLDKLLPTAEKYGGHHLCVYGIVAGMAVMAVSLAMLG
ncbi:zinc transporter ZupT [Kocuria palustris]|uniref:zinc transporter ZupT n=1 Tax=Kocuria palustris TaxID=71999 RepID=UPI0019D1DEE5|nr:zinc transporter ZupT [Kocuria palustris]MBN6751999.1 zinc transporter ZupT [Kocuria palustris]MBN6756954.1 zinc transporter ZupT [Kocuria palustris]MBN6761982.1 zinc transporter ZupT [Kocuria palustris]MBN6781464.1 zinc transporter ZupT [Kocuria palustris]MBN6797948.1 zinc transporter ZupT [Kocuria palustris]